MQFDEQSGFIPPSSSKLMNIISAAACDLGGSDILKLSNRPDKSQNEHKQAAVQKALCDWLQMRVCSLRCLCQCFPPSQAIKQESDALVGMQVQANREHHHGMEISHHGELAGSRYLLMSITNVIW